MNLEQQRDTIIDIAARHGARNVRVFGSVARGDDRPASDLDLLVDMESDRSFLDLVGLAQDLDAETPSLTASSCATDSRAHSPSTGR